MVCIFNTVIWKLLTTVIWKLERLIEAIYKNLTATFDDKGTTHFNKWIVYLFLGKTFVWVHPFPLSCPIRSLFSFCRPNWTGPVKFTAWKVSKYGVFSGPYFPVFGLNTGKYGTAKTLYLNTFHAVRVFKGLLIFFPSVAAAIDIEGEKTPPTIWVQWSGRKWQ